VFLYNQILCYLIFYGISNLFFITNSVAKERLDNETVFQSCFFALFKMAVLAFREWSERTFGPVGLQLAFGSLATVPALKTLWEQLTGRPITVLDARPSAFDEVMFDVASERNAEDGKVSADHANIAVALGHILLAFFKPGQHVGRLDEFLLLSHIKAATASLSLSAASTSQHRNSNRQILGLARWQFEQTETGRAQRVGKAEREMFWLQAEASKRTEAEGDEPTDAAMAAIPSSTCFTPYVPIPRDERELVPVGLFGLSKGVPIAHVIIAFLRDTRILDTAAARALQKKGQDALTLSPATRAFAQTRADERKEKLGVDHMALRWLKSTVPADMAPAFDSAFILVQNACTRLEGQLAASHEADAKFLATVVPILALLRLSVDELLLAAKLQNNCAGIVYGTNDACMRFRDKVPALQRHVAAVTAELLALSHEVEGGTTAADLGVVVERVRAMVQRHTDSATAKLAARAPVRAAPAGLHAAFAANTIAIKGFLEKLTGPAMRVLSSQKLPTLTVNGGHLSSTRLLEVYRCVLGFHDIPNVKSALLSDEDKVVLGLVSLKQVYHPGESRRWLFSRFLAADHLSKVYTDGWAPTSLCYTGQQLNVKVGRPSGAAAHERDKVEQVLFRGQFFSRANIFTLGTFLQHELGAVWGAIPLEVWLEIGDVVLSLLFGTVVSRTTPGFMVQERQLTPLLDDVCNAAPREFHESFDWLVLGLRNADPGRFAIGCDPGLS
jgi:hypothetical protein